MISVVAYMLLGLAGLPIFSEGGGIWYIFKPSFGYIIGFCLGTYVTGLIAERLKQKTVFHYLLANLAGLMIVYACGMVYYYVICNYVIDTPIGIWPLILYCFLLAVPGDIALSVLGAVIAKRVRPVVLQYLFDSKSNVRLETEVSDHTLEKSACSSRSRRMVMVIDLSSFLSVHFGRTIKSFGMIIPPVKHLLVNIVIIISIAYSNFDFCNHCYDIKYSYTGLTLI